MTNTNFSKYVVEIHEKSFNSDSLASFYSDTPFLAIHVGDYLAPLPGGEGTLKKGQTYRIVGIQHILTKKTDPSHKICVCVKSVPYPEVIS